MRYSSILWNLFGLGIPLIIAAISVPTLLSQIGAERFGFLALAWGLIGYAGALDLGIGRATTQHISALRGAGQNLLVGNALATAIKITVMSGMVGMLCIVLVAVTGGYQLIHATAVPSSEIFISVLLLAITLPLQAISATYRGVNEAYLNFKGISIIRIMLGAANFGAPLLVMPFTIQLYWLVATLLVSRGLALILYRLLAHRCILRAGGQVNGNYDPSVARELLRFGGWFTLSSMLSPILMQADRFSIGALIAASAITVYVIPYEVVVQSLVVVGAVTTVAFPVISHLIVGNKREALRVFNVWLKRVIVVMALGVGVLAYILPDLLGLWLGKSVAPESITVGRILCLGVVCNAIGAMHFSLLHAYKLTKQTAILHMIEVPLFLVGLYFMITYFGVVGAAIAWATRMAFDATAMRFLVWRHVVRA